MEDKSRIEIVIRASMVAKDALDMIDVSDKHVLKLMATKLLEDFVDLDKFIKSIED